MAKRILGIDMGSNSIGWALIDEEEQKIIAAGVRVFPEGVDRDQQGGELSKNETRRTKRGQRRLLARRARRKRRLFDLLQREGLIPTEEEAVRELFQADPYALRKRALEERLTLQEIGRVIYHLNQRRGFQSNRKGDRAKKKETSEMLTEISELAKRIEESGAQTLGEYLAREKEQDGARVRGWHTHREMFKTELEAIWAKQREYHPVELREELLEAIRDIIFFQRDMYWRKATIGKCELEKKERRCERADRLAQKFRLYQEVNNLRLLDTQTGEERPLTETERAKLIQRLMKTKSRTFDQIRQDLGLSEFCQFNLERAKRTKLLGMETDAVLGNKKIFGKRWGEFSEEQKDGIVRTLLEAETDSEIHKQAIAEWGLDAEAAEQLIEAGLPEGYASFSRKAIARLLPYLEQGLLLMTNDNTPSALVSAGYLRPDQRPVEIHTRLPKPPDIPNPIVRQGLYEFRKLVNAIIQEYGKPDAIHIELAREVKGSPRQREEWMRQIKQREKQREEARNEIQAYVPMPSRIDITKYLLWEEQDQMCVYTGKMISLAQLFSSEVNIDHILPYPRSLDDSLMNKVVCFRTANAEKKDRTPYEWLGEMDPELYETVLQRVRRLPYPKRRKFTLKKVELDDFIARQLNDTQYMSRVVAQYVRSLGTDVVCTKGQYTADLRHAWGLDTILDDKGTGIKNRDNHRHHAVDALVIALANRSRLQQLARSRAYRVDPSTFEEPWPAFRQEVEAKVNAIYVSHRPLRKIRGALHEETHYGPTRKPGVFSYRKPVTELTLAMIPKIKDPVIREIVAERVRAFGLEPGGSEKIKAEVWKDPLTMPSGVPIKKVRLEKEDSSIQPIRDGKVFVKPGNNHHVCLYEYETEAGETKRYLKAVTMLEAVQRIQRGEPVIQRQDPDHPEARFLFSLSTNDLILLDNNGNQDLYRFETAYSANQIKFRHHTYAGKSSTSTRVVTKSPNTLQGQKVIIDRLGRIRWAND